MKLVDINNDCLYASCFSLPRWMTALKRKLHWNVIECASARLGKKIYKLEPDDPDEKKEITKICDAIRKGELGKDPDDLDQGIKPLEFLEWCREMGELPHDGFMVSWGQNDSCRPQWFDMLPPEISAPIPYLDPENFNYAPEFAIMHEIWMSRFGKGNPVEGNTKALIEECLREKGTGFGKRRRERITLAVMPKKKRTRAVKNSPTTIVNGRHDRNGKGVPHFRPLVFSSILEPWIDAFKLKFGWTVREIALIIQEMNPYETDLDLVFGGGIAERILKAIENGELRYLPGDLCLRLAPLDVMVWATTKANIPCPHGFEITHNDIDGKKVWEWSQEPNRRNAEILGLGEPLYCDSMNPYYAPNLALIWRCWMAVCYESIEETIGKAIERWIDENGTGLSGREKERARISVMPERRIKGGAPRKIKEAV